MPRRLAVSLSAVFVMVLAAATIALASGGSSGGTSGGSGTEVVAAPSTATVVPAAGKRPFRHPGLRGRRGAHGGAMLGVLRRLVLASGAGRLGVEQDALRAAVKAVAKEQRAKRVAAAKLGPLPKPDLAALKTELSDALGAKLGLSGAKVLEAARAELSARLDQGVKMGFLTADGKTKALACFDAPASCNVKALHKQLRFRGHGGAHKRGLGHARRS